MFFEGTLQEGITSAVEQAKLVVCFVTDGQPESQKWETEFLTDENLREHLAKEAVVLKLQAGSTEAGYLAAIFPLPKTPTLVCIKNGELKEYIASGVSKEEFSNRLAKALGVTLKTVAPSSSQTPATSQPAASSIRSSSSVLPSSNPSASSPPAAAATQATPAVAAPSSSSSSPPAASQGAISNERVQSFLARQETQRKAEAERRRLEAERKKKEDTTKPKVSDAQSKHLEEIRKRRRQEKEARDRVLKQIEDDKAARRAAREEAKLSRMTSADAAAEDVVAPSQSKPLNLEGTCKLQIRLFDGSTVRGQFPASQRLDPDIRRWIDETPSMADSGVGYAFKVIQTPAPSRTIDVGEEAQTLGELGLAPSATLVLVPAKKQTAGAYASDGGNVLSRILVFIFGFLGTIMTFFTSLLSTAGTPAGVHGTDQEQHAMTSGHDQRPKTGIDRARQRREDQQYYNGNSVNFEARPDEDDEDKRK